MNHVWSPISQTLKDVHNKQWHKCSKNSQVNHSCIYHSCIYTCKIYWMHHLSKSSSLELLFKQKAKTSSSRPSSQTIYGRAKISRHKRHVVCLYSIQWSKHPLWKTWSHHLFLFWTSTQRIPQTLWSSSSGERVQLRAHDSLRRCVPVVLFADRKKYES